MEQDSSLNYETGNWLGHFEVVVGYIDKVKKNPLRVDVYLFGGGYIKDLKFGFGGRDKITGNPHGIFIPPRKDQIVGVMFIEGNATHPFMAFYLPIPLKMADEQKFADMILEEEDITVCHFTGSNIILRKNGDIEIKQKAGQKVKLGSGTLKKLLNETAVTIYNGHTHPFIGNLGIPAITSPTTAAMSAANETNDIEAS